MLTLVELKTISVRDLRQKWPEAERALKIESEILITRDGIPVAKLTRIENLPKKRRRFDPAKHGEWQRRQGTAKTVSWVGRISGLLNFLLAYFSSLWKKELHVAAGDLSGTKDIARRARMVAWMDSNAWGLESEALGAELCVLWDWRNGVGRLEDFAARSFLCKLAERGLIELPPVREYKRSGAQTLGWVKGDFEHTPEPLCAELKRLRPVELDWVQAGSEGARRVAFYLDRYHYLGWHVVGQNIGYLARDSSGRDLAVLLFGAAAWRCAARDRYLNWSESEHLVGLQRI